MSTDTTVPSHITIDPHVLKPVGVRPPLPEYLRRLWDTRRFIWVDARSRALGSQRNTILGNVWLIAKPILDASVFLVMFGIILQTSRGIPNFIGYLLIGVTMFPAYQKAITAGCMVMHNRKGLIRGFTFPRASIPISFTIQSAIDTLPPLAAILTIVMLMPPHAWPSRQWILVVPIFALQMLLCFGLTLLTSRFTTRIPDLKNIWSFFTSFWYFSSGIFFSFDRFVDHPTLLAALDFNPGYLTLKMYRACILYHETPPLHYWAIMTAWAAGLTLISFILFWRAEESYAAER